MKKIPNLKSNLIDPYVCEEIVALAKKTLPK